MREVLFPNINVINVLISPFPPPQDTSTLSLPSRHVIRSPKVHLYSQSPCAKQSMGVFMFVRLCQPGDFRSCLRVTDLATKV